ncbi:unnamed protein product, partial [Linum tenue]
MVVVVVAALRRQCLRRRRRPRLGKTEARSGSPLERERERERGLLVDIRWVAASNWQ